MFGAEVPTEPPSDAGFEAIRRTLESGDVGGGPGDTVGPMPVVSADQMGSPSLLEPIQAFRWFVDYGGRYGTHWRNEATRVVPSDTAPYSPFECAPHVRVPSLVMVAAHDEMVHANPVVSRAAYELLGGEKEWYDLDGGHFGLLYHPSELFDAVSSAQARFLVDRFGVEPA